jgi:hypothetical protein
MRKSLLFAPLVKRGAALVVRFIAVPVTLLLDHI